MKPRILMLGEWKYWMRDLIYLSVLAVLLPWLVVRRMRTGRYQDGVRQKLFGLRSRDLPSDTPSPQSMIWLHGVSVGEVQFLAALLERLEVEFPSVNFALSTTTESGMALARKWLSGRSASSAVSEKPASARVQLFYFPTDLSWAVRRTLNELKPALIVLGELELWPNLLDCASSHQIPVVVVNGRLSERSFRGYRRLRWLTRPMFRKLTRVGAQTATYAERFQRCGCQVDRVIETGNLKFDNVAFSKEDGRVEALRKLAGIEASHRVVIFGSTQDPEEQAAIDAFLDLQRDFPDLKLIVVPRHPDRFDQVFQTLNASSTKVIRRSQLPALLPEDTEHLPCGAACPTDNSLEPWQVLLVDTVGELRWWWGLAEIAVVGGSFGRRGGQNMLEPAAYGINVAFGPNTSNFRDIVDLLLSQDAATRIPDVNCLTNWLREQLTVPEIGRERGQRAREVIARQQGASRTTIELLRQVLKEQSLSQRAA